MRHVPHPLQRQRQLEKGATQFQRDGDRNPCDVKCSLVLEHGAVEARLRDFSERGFRVSVPVALLVGSEAQLVLPNCMPVQAKVMWSLGGTAGCLFARPIKEHLMRMAIDAAKWG